MMQIKSRKKAVAGILAFLLSAVLLLCGLVLCVTKKADAAEIQTDIFSEDFDGKDFSDEWKNPVNAELQIREYSMRYNGSSRWGSGICPMTHKITGNTEISFDIEVSGNGWLSFVFGLPRYNSSIEYGDVGTWFWQDCTRLMDDGKGTLGGPTDTTMGDYATFSVSPWQYSKTSLRYVLTKKDNKRESDNATMYKIELYLYEAGGNCPASPSAVYDNVELDGYYAFSSMGALKMTVTNFLVKEGESTVFEDDFTDSAFMFDNDPTPGAKWAVTYFDPSTLAVGPTADVKIVTGSADGNITNARGIARDVRVEKQFTFSVEVSLSEMSLSTVFGMEFGDGKFFAGLEKTEAGQYRAVTVAGGEITEATESAAIKDDGKIVLTFEGYSDGRITVAAENQSYTLSGGDFGGAFKLGTKHIGENSVDEGYVIFDNAHLQSYSYDAAPDAQDYSINFKGVRTYEESGETLYEYYVNRNQWLMQGCTSPLYRAGQTRNYVQFSESNVSMLFGPKQRYSEFICRFSVTVTDDAAVNESAVLLSFGRQNLSDAAWDTPYLVFTKKPRGMEIAGGGGVLGTSATGDVSFWNNRDENKNLISYDVMVTVIEGKIEVYYAPSGADTSEMGILRGTFAYDDTKGYVAVSGHNGASFRVGSFAVTNINANNTNAAQVFDTSGIQTVDGQILLSNGATVATNDAFGEFMMYAKVKPVLNGSIHVMFPNGSGIEVSEGNVVGKSLKNMQTGARLEKMLCGKEGTLYVRVLNNHVTVGYAAADEPMKFITEPAAEFDLPRGIENGKISLSANDGAAVLLESVSIYSLDAKIEIATQDYDPNLDEDLDKVKPEFGETENPEKETNWGVIGGIIGGVSGGAILAAAAVVTVIIVRKKKRGTK